MSRITVYIPCHNQAHCIGAAIESVLHQSRPADEILVIDDASSDESPSIVRGYAERHPDAITAIFNEENRGISPVRNQALSRDGGDYVTYVDGDDRCLANKLEVEAAILDAEPAVGFVFSNHRYLAADGQHSFLWAEEERPPEGNVFAETLGREFPMQRLFRMEMVRAAAWREIGFYDESLAVYEDYDMRIRLAQAKRCRYADAVTAELQEHDHGLSKLDARKRFAAVQMIFRSHEAELGRLEAKTAKRIRRSCRHWAAQEAYSALQAGLADTEGSRWRRWARNVGYLLFCLRHRPEIVPGEVRRRALRP